jgi:hypothetical protein
VTRRRWWWSGALVGWAVRSAGTFDGAPQGALGELVGEVALVGLGAALVGGRVAAPCAMAPTSANSSSDGVLAAQRVGDLVDAGGVGADGGEADATLGIVPPSIHTAAPAETTAQSPARRSTFS